MNIKFRSKPIIIVATAGAVLAGVSGYLWQEEHRPPLLEIYIFHVKGGQATFIRTPDDKRVLVNGGSNSEIIRRIGKVLPFYSRRIDTLIAVDTLGNHITGLVDITNRYRVDQAYVPAITLQSLGLSSSTDPIYKTLLRTFRDHVVPVAELKMNDRIDLGRQVEADVLFPTDDPAFTYSKASGPELVFNMTYGDTSFLFAGSVTKKIQKYIASSSAASIVGDLRARTEAGSPIRQHAFIVSGSGAPDDLSSELLEIMSPQEFVYSKGVSRAVPAKNSSTGVQARPDPLEAVARTQRWNTQDTGGVKIVSDGKKIVVSLIR